MTTSFTRSAGVWNSERGEFISDDHAKLADALADYNRGFSLVYIPEKERSAEDTKPFAILHTPSDTTKAPYIMRYLTAVEMRDPAAVLGWVFANDLSKNPNRLQQIEAEDRARKVMEARQQEDDLLERADLAMSILKSPLHTYSLGGDRKIRS